MQHSKLSLPRLAQGTARPRLFTQLDKAQVAWITAPAGAGKTTLAATYILERHVPYLWYQLDKDDLDPATFFYYLGLATKSVLSNKKISLPRLVAEYFNDISGFATRYFHTLALNIPTGSVLVLDNYQELANDSLFPQVLLSAIRQMSLCARFIILSRELPPSIIPTALKKLITLGWNDVRLTLEETRAIIVQRYRIEENKVIALHSLAGGWPAGLTLLMEQLQHNLDVRQSIDPDSREMIFSFFNNEFFSKLATQTQEFLLKTAVPLEVTPALAEEITDNITAGQILQNLHNRQFFMHYREHVEPSYQYHSLLREFLLSKLAERYSQSDYSALIHHIACVLVKHGQEEEAVALYIRHCDWEIAIPLVLSQAPKLIALGRAQLLAGWLACIPDSWLVSTPWLLYWKGVSQIGFKPFIAQELLQSAFTAFDAEENSIGKILSASAIIDISYFLRKSLISAEPWAEIIQIELKLDPEFPSLETEARVLTSLLSLLTYLRPQEGKLALYAGRLLHLMAYDLSIDQKIRAATYLVHYYTMIESNFQPCESLIVNVEAMLRTQEATALSQILWRTLSSPYHTLINNREKAYSTVIPLPLLANQNSLNFMEGLSIIYVATIYHNFGDYNKAFNLLQHAEKLIINDHPADIAWLNLSKSVHALSRSEYKKALEYGSISLRLTESLGAVLILVEIHCLLGLINCELADYDEANKHLKAAEAKSFAGSPRIKREAYQVKSYIYLKTGQLSKCHNLLKKAFFIASQHGFFSSWLCWNHRMMSRLCMEAVKKGIEPKYVKHFIHERMLTSEDPILDAWPWPIKIYCLGDNFHVLTDSDQKSSLQFKGQQQKLVLMLKAIIASGGKDIRIENLCEVLWREAEGDTAASAFTTTLARLRKLIGQDTLQIYNGKISIDTRHCWVDALALDLYIDNIKSIEFNNSSIEALEVITRLYRGPFLRDDDETWAQAYRNRLRKKVSHLIRQCLATSNRKRDGRKIKYLIEKIEQVDNKLNLNFPS